MEEKKVLPLCTWHELRILRVRELADKADVRTKIIYRTERGTSTIRPNTKRASAATLGSEALQVEEWQVNMGEAVAACLVEQAA